MTVQNIGADRRDAILQLLRFAVGGGLVTLIGSAVYWVAAVPGDISPMLSNLLSYLVAVTIGYIVHSRWSFRGHGAGNGWRTSGKFFAASLVSLAINSLWVWILLTVLHGAVWWPTITMIFVTPVIVFWINRKWVFA